MTKIEWTDRAWNPVTGCTKVSPGCANCYAESVAGRLGRMSAANGYKRPPRHFDVTPHPDRLEVPYAWKTPKRVFVCSMGDLFHEGVPDEFIHRVYQVMHQCPQHTFQVLTKRPQRMLDIASYYCRAPGIINSSNIWFGVSVEDQQRADERIPLLLQMPPAPRFVSCEPLLGPVEINKRWLTGAPRVDWVIAGCESGPNRRPADADWFRSLRDQCAAAGVPFFLKQMDVEGRVVKMPKLDGVVHDAIPALTTKDDGPGGER